MSLPTGYQQIRSGFIEVGDVVYIKALAVYSEVTADSVYVGSPVRYQHSVHRDPRRVVETGKIPTHEELCDELQEHDGVVLRSNGFEITRRVVVYKDEQFVYLRQLSPIVGETSATSDRICRRTGKAWAWTVGGWELKTWTLGSESPYHTGGFVGKSFIDGGLHGA